MGHEVREGCEQRVVEDVGHAHQADGQTEHGSLEHQEEETQGKVHFVCLAVDLD